MPGMHATLSAMISPFYWLVIFAWFAVFILLLSNAKLFLKRSRVLALLCGALAIDAFRTIVENIYFGRFFNEYFGWMPVAILRSGEQPAYLIGIKLLTFTSAIITFVLLRRLIPAQQVAAERLADQGKDELRRDFAKRIEEEHASLNMAQSVAKIGSWTLDIETMAVTWSEENYRIYERDPGTFQPSQSNIPSFFSDEDAAIRQQLFNESLETGQPAIVEHRLMVPGGRTKYVEERWRVVTNSSGRPARVIGTCQDITERKQAQQALRASESFAQATIDSVSADICVLDEDGKIITVNLAWREFCHQGNPQPHSLQAYLGSSYLGVFESAFGADAIAATTMATGIRQVMDGVVPEFTLEYPCHSSTEQRWFQIRVTRFRDASSNVVIAHENITGRKLAEIGMKRLNRVYAVLSETNMLIVRVRDRDELFREACRIMVQSGGLGMSMIGIVDRTTCRVAPIATAGENEELLQAMSNAFASDEKALTTLVAKAVEDKAAIVSNDIEIDTFTALREQYTETGFCSLAVLPLMVANEVVAILALYANERDFFHEEEMKLLTELANDVAFAMDHIEQQERLDLLASYDPLTGLANRRLFLERLMHFMRGAADHGGRLSLFLIDLERFKNINDTLGQTAGDLLLQQVAAWLIQHLGDVNRVARVGADQFALVLLEDNQLGDVSLQLEAMIEAFLGHSFLLDGDRYRIAAKFGAAVFPDDGTNAEFLYKNAEAALKKAKLEGQRHLFYAPKMTETVAQQLKLENQLRRALENDEFVLHYQPKVSIDSGQVIGVEALIRWNDPLTGLVPPGLFIPTLEQTGLISEVGRWALQKSLEDYLRWRDAGLHAVRIAVNVSPLQFRHPGFIASLERIVASDVRAANGLELEITEGIIMGDMQQAIASLQAIRALGIVIAIDDFGTGFSSLGYLSKLPIDTLKIDRMFVTDMVVNPRGLSLVSTIISLAHSMNLKVVAEGVESEEQAKLLRLLKCDEMQGYLFSKPVPVDILEEKFLRLSPQTLNRIDPIKKSIRLDDPTDTNAI